VSSAASSTTCYDEMKRIERIKGKQKYRYKVQHTERNTYLVDLLTMT